MKSKEGGGKSGVVERRKGKKGEGKGKGKGREGEGKGKGRGRGSDKMAHIMFDLRMYTQYTSAPA